MDKIIEKILEIDENFKKELFDLHIEDIDDLNPLENTLLYTACYSGSLEIVKYLVENGADLNKKCHSRRLPIHVAAGCGFQNIVEYLIENGSKIDSLDEELRTPLHLSLLYKHPEIAILLIKKNSKVNFLETISPIHLACMEGYKNVVECLIEHDADVNILSPTNIFPLKQACSYGHMDIFELLLNNGANIDMQTDESSSVLHLAIKKKDIELVRIIVRRGADVDLEECKKSKNTPLINAAKEESLEIVKILLENGAEPDLSNKNWETPLHIACQKENFPIIKCLLEHDADPNTDATMIQQPMTILCEKRNIEIIRKMVPMMKEIIYEEQEINPLHVAVEENMLDFAQEMIDAGYDLETENDENYTPLILAIREKNLEMVKLLVENGAEIGDCTTEGELPLNCAVMVESVEIIIFLVEKGANIYQKDGSDICPIQFSFTVGFVKGCMYFLSFREHPRRDLEQYLTYTCTSTGNTELIEKLLDMGVEIGTDEDKSDYLRMVCHKGNAEAAKLLLQRGAKKNNKDRDIELNLLLISSVVDAYTDVVKVLVEEGAMINYTSRFGLNAFHESTKIKNIDQQRFEFVKLHNSIGKNDKTYKKEEEELNSKKKFNIEITKIFKYLIENGGDIYSRDEHGIDIIEKVNSTGNSEMIEIMKKHLKERTNLLLCVRKFVSGSDMSEDNMPLDIFKYILFLSGLIKNPFQVKETKIVTKRFKSEQR